MISSPPPPRDAPAEAPSRRWSFGPAVLDESRLELRVCGQIVDIEPKSLEVLLHLLHHADEVVTKDELFDAVWPGRVLTESAVTRTVGRLREALGDGDQQLVRTVHGYGWRLIAPVTVEAIAGPTLPRFDFRPGDAPHLRPEWRLLQCLGRGGHGEVWLARRHDATQECRVFKYAYDAPALASLKREITLNRVLRESLGDRAACVAILRWNLESPPCFIEAEYIAGGSLDAWARARGGLQAVPLAARLDLMVQLAEAVAAAHSVGVLHKDLKPSNVMVDDAGGTPRIRLADFGSGGVLDAARLDALGITRLGFTQTVGDPGNASGTAPYLPPEVLAGQPATVKGDVYALGVMLYQCVIGDLKKPLAPGWEQDVDDEILREDIAEAASGNPARRLSDAAQLAERLRTVEARRSRRAAETAARAQAEREKAVVERALARRGWVRATIASLAAGLVISVALAAYAFHARREALESAATTRAVSQFLNEDLLAQAAPQRHARKDPTIREALDLAAGKVDRRFAGQPEVAARLHVTLGQAYMSLSEYPAAALELEKAVSLFDGIGQSAAPEGLEARSLHAEAVYWRSSGAEQPLAILDRALKFGVPSLGPAHPQIIDLAGKRAFYRMMTPEFAEAPIELRAILDDARRAGVPDEQQAYLHFMLGATMLNLSDPAQAEHEFREALRLYAATPANPLALKIWLASAILDGGRLADAERLLGELETEVEREPGDSMSRNYFTWTIGLLRMEQDRLAEAEAVLLETQARFAAVSGPDALETRYRFVTLAELRRRQGRLAEAEGYARTFVTALEQAAGPQSFMTIGGRALLADILREQGRVDEAWQVVRDSDTRAELRQDLPTINYAMLRRAEGLLWLGEGKADKARAALADALRIREARYPPEHALSRQWRKELAGVPRP